MILKNPTNGAPIEFPTQGKVWKIGVGETVEFEDAVGATLKSVYGFLEEVSLDKIAVPAILQEVKEGEVSLFRCSVCGYKNKTKVAVLGHLRSHDGKGIPAEEIKTAEPIGDAPKKPTIMEARLAKADGEDVLPGKSENWYGEGMVEGKPASRSKGGVPGHFGGV